MLELGIVISVWYAASAVAGSTTRHLLSQWPAPLWLCTVQFVTASCLGLVLARKARGGNALHASVSGTVWKISAAYTLGFLCLSSTMVYVTVSLSETLRATEPLFTVVLAWAIMRDAPSMSVVVALVPTVTGVSLAAMGGTGFSGMGLAMAMFSNAAFSMRSVWTKVLRRQCEENGIEIDGVALLYHVSRRGLVLLFAAHAIAVALLPSHLESLFALADVPTCMVNGVAFFTYNQMSFLVLSRVHVLTHAVANGFRRVATIIAAVLYFGTPVSAVAALGMALAVVGVLLYAYAASAAMAPRKPPAPV